MKIIELKKKEYFTFTVLYKTKCSANINNTFKSNFLEIIRAL